MGALDEFRKQQLAAEAVQAKLAEVSTLLKGICAMAHTLVKDERLIRLLEEEQQWLRRAEAVVKEARSFREWDGKRFWPAVWPRWFAAVMLTCATNFVWVAGYAWISRGYRQEIEALRQKHEMLDGIADRLLQMSPAERQQFDTLMRQHDPRRH